MRGDGRNDFIEFDAITANLDLIIDSAQEGNLSIRQPARQITGAVKSRIRGGTEGIGNELLGGQLRIVAITSGHAGASYVEFADGSHGYLLQLFVQNIDLRIVNRPADGRKEIGTFFNGNSCRSRDNGALGWTVVIDQREG